MILNLIDFISFFVCWRSGEPFILAPRFLTRNDKKVVLTCNCFGVRVCVHVWIIQSLSTTLCATYNMLQLIPWVKSGPVAKLLLKKKPNHQTTTTTSNEQKAPNQTNNQNTPNQSSSSSVISFSCSRCKPTTLFLSDFKA